MEKKTNKLKEDNTRRKDDIFQYIEISVHVSDEDKDLTQNALKYFYQEMSGKEEGQEDDEDEGQLKREIDYTSKYAEENQYLQEQDQKQQEGLQVIEEESASILQKLMAVFFLLNI